MTENNFVHVSHMPHICVTHLYMSYMYTYIYMLHICIYDVCHI